MSLRETADRLRKDVVFLRELSYINGGGDVLIRGPSVAALLQSLGQTLLELDASTATDAKTFDAVMEKIRERSSKAQADLNAQAAAASEADRSLNKPPGQESPVENPTGENPG